MAQFKSTEWLVMQGLRLSGSQRGPCTPMPLRVPGASSIQSIKSSFFTFRDVTLMTLPAETAVAQILSSTAPVSPTSCNAQIQ